MRKVLVYKKLRVRNCARARKRHFFRAGKWKSAH